MNIIWLSWKDCNHPQAGGAEVVSSEIMKRLVRDGHNVTLLTARYPNSSPTEICDGVKIQRQGNKFSVYMETARVFNLEYSEWADLVIDEMNTIPFISPLYQSKAKRVLFSHQLAREVWFYQMTFPFSLVGYVIEPLYLKYISQKYDRVVTVSNSTKVDMERYGFRDVKVFSVGMELAPIKKLSQKSNLRTVLSLGAVRPMKRTLDIIKAFEFARDYNPHLNLVIIGDVSTKYSRKVVRYIESSRHSKDIKVKGRVSAVEKREAIRHADVLLVASIKEGWGLTVTEANSQGVVAVGYNVDGLRDSIRDGITGCLSRLNTPLSLAASLNKLLDDKDKYRKIQKNAWTWSKEFTFENSYQSFIKVVLSEE